MAKKSGKRGYLDRLLGVASSAYTATGSLYRAARKDYNATKANKIRYTRLSDQLDSLQTKYDELLSKYNSLMDKLSTYSPPNAPQPQNGNSIPPSNTTVIQPKTMGALDPGNPRLSQYDKSLNREEGEGIGDIYANQIKAKLLQESEGPQAKVAGEEAGLEETLRRNLVEEKSMLYPTGIGSDNKENYKPLPENEHDHLPLFRTDVTVMKDSNGNYRHDKLTNDFIYSGMVEFRFRPREWFFHGYGAGTDKDSILNRVYAHAQNSRVGFGNKFERRWYNPHVEGKDFSFDMYGPMRWNIVAGLFTGYRASLSLNGITAKRLKELILAIDPRSGKDRLYQEENA